MTAQEYRAALRKLGFTPARPSYGGATIHEGRDGTHTTVPDPETLSDVERADFIALLESRLGS